MGILRDANYWKGVTEEMFRIRPVRGRVMSREDTVRFLETACKALNDLTEDRELFNDLKTAAQILEQQGKGPPLYAENFDSFLAEFCRGEGALLMQSGMDFDCAVDLVEELRAAARLSEDVSPSTVLGLAEQLKVLRDKTCRAAADERLLGRRTTRTTNIWRLVKGYAAIGIDCAASAGVIVFDPVVSGPIVASTVGGASIGFGTALVLDAKKGLEDDD